MRSSFTNAYPLHPLPFSYFQAVGLGEMALVGVVSIHPDRSLDFGMLVRSIAVSANYSLCLLQLPLLLSQCVLSGSLLFVLDLGICAQIMQVGSKRLL